MRLVSEATAASTWGSQPFMFVWRPEAFSGANEKRAPLYLIRVKRDGSGTLDQITDVYQIDLYQRAE